MDAAKRNSVFLLPQTLIKIEARPIWDRNELMPIRTQVDELSPGMSIYMGKTVLERTNTMFPVIYERIATSGCEF